MSGPRTPSWRLDPRALARSPRLAAALARLAERSGRPLPAVQAEALRALAELRTGYVGGVHRAIVRAGRALCRAGYDAVDYDPREVERVRAVFARHPAVVLSSHRSYLDGGALNVGFAEHGLPPLAVFAGINMAFWPVGAIWRRAQTVFIRRQGAGDAYKAALREVVATLAGRRVPLQWFIEGTRSRSGRMGAPRIGLLAYVVEAVREGRVDDAMLVPVSVTYERLREVSDYAAEARGAAKQREGLGWLVGFVRRQQGRFGRIYVRFGEPVAVRAAIAEHGDTPALLPWLAAEATRRIERATAVTGTALVATALLEGSRGATAGDGASPLPWLRERALALAAQAGAQRVPMAPTAALDAATFTDVVAGLAAQGLVECAPSGTDGGPATLRIVAGARDAVAYYANTIAHVLEPPAA